ncbi:phage tail protein [Yersinia enterocolitica]
MANEILPFGLGAESNVMTQAEYEALAARSSGFSSGVAKSEQLNKVWRQSSFMASVLADFIAARSGNDVLDNGNTATLLASLELAIKEYANSNLPVASTLQQGITKLSSLTNSSSETLAATLKAVKTVSDEGLKITGNLAEIKAAGPAAIAEAQSNLDLAALLGDALQKANNLSEIKTAGPAAVAQTLLNLGLGIRGLSTFTASGSWTCPEGVTTVYIDACGGGGGGAYSSPGATGGGGGGGAAAVIGASISVTPGVTYTVTIGGPGAAGTSSSVNGVAGGATSFGSLLVLNGGGGGLSSAGAGVGGGTGGNAGTAGVLNGGLSFGGSGGGCVLGNGGAGGSGAMFGTIPGQYGGGGGGGANGGSGARGAYGILKLRW